MENSHFGWTDLRGAGHIRDSAAAVIFVHNHPSGDPTPSREDLEITRRLRDVGEIVGVRVLDHVIIGAGRYVSLVWLCGAAH